MSGTRASTYPNPFRGASNNEIDSMKSIIRCWRRDETNLQDLMRDGWEIGEPAFDSIVREFLQKAKRNLADFDTMSPKVRDVVYELIPMGLDELHQYGNNQRGSWKNRNLKHVLGQINVIIETFDQDIHEELQHRGNAALYGGGLRFSTWSDDYTPPPTVSGYYGPSNQFSANPLRPEEEILDNDMIGIAVQRSLDDQQVSLRTSVSDRRRNAGNERAAHYGPNLAYHHHHHSHMPSLRPTHTHYHHPHEHSYHGHHTHQPHRRSMYTISIPENFPEVVATPPSLPSTPIGMPGAFITTDDSPPFPSNNMRTYTYRRSRHYPGNYQPPSAEDVEDYSD